MNLVLFGAPGSGKGTQSAKLIDEFGLFHISTGEVLRDHIKRGTDLWEGGTGVYLSGTTYSR